MALIGYARVSTKDQNLDLQRDALKAAGCTRIFEDKASGGSMERPELARCLDRLEDGDVLMVWKLDRLGRTTVGVLQLVEDLRTRGVEFRSVTEGLATTGAMGRAFITVLSAFAQMERELIQERTLAGLAAARERGRIGGRPKNKHEAEQARKVVELTGKGLTREQVARTLGLSVPTVYRRQLYARQQAATAGTA